MREISEESGRLAYEESRNRFNSVEGAKFYSTQHTDSVKGQREKACIRQALQSVPQQSLVLDLPCGAGRLTYFVQQQGYRVLGADYSEHMITEAQKKAKDLSSGRLSFERQDVMNISHENDAFDATVCNRLFHHFPTSALRQKALKELARVTRGPIIVSFFSSHCVSAVWMKVKNFLKNNKSLDRLPISPNLFKRDAEAVGLKVESVYFTKKGRSPQMYFKLVKKL